MSRPSTTPPSPTRVSPAVVSSPKPRIPRRSTLLGQLQHFISSKPQVMTAPAIACLGVIGKNNNPLHIQIFPSYNPLPLDGVSIYAPLRTPLQYSLLLSSALDIFAARGSHNSFNAPQTPQASKTPQTPYSRDGVKLSGEYGLLTILDERLMIFGFETNTSVKFVVVVDVRGSRVEGGGEGKSPGGDQGVREGDIKIVFKAMQAAYVRLLQNPFFEPDAHSPPSGKGSKKISSRKFESEMKRIGESWSPGATVS